MNRMRLRLAVWALVLAWTAVVSSAQEFKVVDNPFGEEFDYTVPNLLSPWVEIDGLRFTSISIAPKSGKTIEADKPIPSVISMHLENTGGASLKVLCVVLLEDEYGRQLERVEMKPFKLGGGKAKEHKEKLKIDGTALQRTKKVWLFLEVN